MREIKFRAWDKKQKRMLYPVDIFNEPGLVWEDTTEGILELNRIIDSFGMREELELMQFTELLDKKGKEIYEGDIVKWWDTKAHVEFRNGKFTASIHDDFTVTNWKACEVIGNSFENGDLLK